MILLAWCTAAGAIGGVVSFWLMFALVEWLFAKDEPRRKPRQLGPSGYRAQRFDPLA
jgi:hypothetical protein